MWMLNFLDCVYFGWWSEADMFEVLMKYLTPARRLCQLYSQEDVVPHHQGGMLLGGMNSMKTEQCTVGGWCASVF